MKQALPILTWLLWLVLAGPTYLQSNWEVALVLFAAWMLVPEGLVLLGLRVSPLYWASVVLLSVAYALNDSTFDWRAVPALPYVGLALWLTVREAARLLEIPKIQLTDIVRVAALAYWATGAVFAFCFLAGLQPLGFDAVIVSLTAAHFHVAGFVLAVVAYCMLKVRPGRFTSVAGWAVLAGMPSVAMGIVLTKLGYSPTFEWVSALFFAVFAALIVEWHLLQSVDRRFPMTARRFWLAGALCLLGGVSLATLYALRFHFPMAWINIPNMKIWHGTLNTLGFAWLTLRGWRFFI
ncbi:MAG TPA: YndJ family transporter [Saprospiraceae bacterium]|nr:YndJ family transporter [Saprospiraceae bacterium]HPI05327.1 YndJ family transporter [Saprospiraceae bacterium]